MSELEVVLEQVNRARRPEDLFDAASDEQGQRDYRRLARLLHPDRNPDDTERCQRAFARVSELWAERGKATDGHPDGFIVHTKRRTFLLEPRPTWQGKIANIYRCTYNEAGEQQFATAKMPRNPRNSDLMTKEAMALRTLHIKGDEDYRPYVPRHVESFRHRDKKDNKERMTNVLDIPPGMFSLREVYQAYPVLDPRHVAWIWRRILVACGFVESAGLVHGGITPENVLIQPEQHGLMLIDWCYSTDIGGTVDVIDPQYKWGTPFEIVDKKPVDQRTDIYMATATMCLFLNGRSPKQFRSFAQGSMPSRISDRPTNAWALQEEFDDLLDRLWGARRFVAFSMPERHDRFAHV